MMKVIDKEGLRIDKYLAEAGVIRKRGPFQADAGMLSGIGDALQKINQVIPDYLTAEKVRELTGI